MFYLAPMQWVDILISVPLIYGLVKGLRNGLLVEVISAVSYLVALYLAMKLAVGVGEWMQLNWKWEASTAQLMAFILLLVAVVVGLQLVASMLTKLVQFSGLGLLNRAGGAVVGALKVALIMSVLLHFVERYQITKWIVNEEKQAQSILWKPLLKFSAIAYPMLGDWYAEAQVIWDKQADPESKH